VAPRADEALEVRLHRLEPPLVVRGTKQVALVEATCSGRGRLLDVSLATDGWTTRASAVRAAHLFHAVLEIPENVPVGALSVTARVADTRGETLRRLATLEVVEQGLPEQAVVAGRSSPPRVAICLATYNPPHSLFERQIESIRRQRYRDFLCIVSDDGSTAAAWREIRRLTADDERFVRYRSPERRGFYRNFEWCLSCVPRGVEYVALADQDDVWRPEKLSTLVATIEATGAGLVYSDMRVLDDDGRLVAPTYWTQMRNNFSRLDALLLRNTVTGASSLFRRELLDDALPFPPEIGRTYHDHWLACVALARGRLAYVDRPLYDWIQHRSNATGRFAPFPGVGAGLVQMLTRFLSEPRPRLQSAQLNAQRAYLADAIRLELFARTLLLRLHGSLDEEQIRTLRRAVGVRTSARSLLWLLGRSLRDPRGHGPAQGTENQLLKALAWQYVTRLGGVQAMAAGGGRSASS
jgi:glycosyltransferase involved in cell wall biosynthesis